MQHGMGARTGSIIWHPGGFRCGIRSMGVRDSMLASFELAPATQARLSVDHWCGAKSWRRRIKSMEGKNASIVDEAAVLSETESRRGAAVPESQHNDLLHDFYHPCNLEH